MGKPRRLQPNAVEPEFQFPSPGNEVDTRSLNNGLMQTPLSDWLIDPSNTTPDTHSNCNDDHAAWPPFADAGFSNFDPEPRSDTDPHQLSSPVHSVSASTFPPLLFLLDSYYHKVAL